jgi:hypothetical protein
LLILMEVKVMDELLAVIIHHAASEPHALRLSDGG